MKIIIYIAQKNVFAIFLILFSFCSLFAQVNNTKIKDGTVSIGAEPAKPGAILELESNNKGMLTPRLTTAQRDVIPIGSLTDGLLIFNTTTGCFDYWSQIQNIWLSMCGTLPPAVFSITTAQCNLVQAWGSYRQGQMLIASNYLTIPVTVTQPGVYSVSATTTNGYYFGASGTFPTAGTYTLNLPGTGTPNNGYVSPDPGDAVNIALNGKSSSCIPFIFVQNADVDYVVNCGVINAVGNYYVGVPLTESNKLTVSVNSSVVGFWSMNTNTVNGYSFSGTGTFTDLTPNQTIELLGTGTPLASGSNSFNLVSNATTTATGACSGIQITVASVEYTINCAGVTQNGNYTQDVPLISTNTITLPINVTATGQTTITTTTANGITFTSGLINLSTLGAQNVTLIGSGMPTASGATALTVSGSPGAAATCVLNVAIGAQPVTYTTTCAGITTSGSYSPGIAMIAANTMTVPVNVTYIGAYSITTNTVNGVSFSGTGTFTVTGAQNVIMTASGTPISGGTFSYAINANSTNGGIACSKAVLYAFRAMNVLGLGEGIYQPASSPTNYSARAILASSANFGTTGTVQIEQAFNYVNGTYSVGTALKNLINTNKIDIIYVGYNGYYYTDASTIQVLSDFVKLKKGVLIFANERLVAKDVIDGICGSNVTISTTNSAYVYNVNTTSDPILNGPFGDLTGKLLGGDGANSVFISNGVPANTTSIATQGTNIYGIKHNTLGFVFFGDGGFVAGYSGDANLGAYPAAISGTGLPQTKNYSGGTIYNSILYANTMAWAVKYAQENTIISYNIP